jgi:hypothetical protein
MKDGEINIGRLQIKSTKFGIKGDSINPGTPSSLIIISPTLIVSLLKLSYSTRVLFL